jgi:hypothetical protein
LFDKIFQHNDPLRFFFKFVAQICDSFFQSVQSHFFYILELKRCKGNFKFENFRRFREKLELFGKKGVFDVFKIKIRIENQLQLVWSVINNGIDDQFVLKLFVKDKGHVELLILGVANDTG